MKEKGQKIELWLFCIPERLKEDMKLLIMEKVRQELEEDRDADLNYILSTLPMDIQSSIRSGIPITRLTQVSSSKSITFKAFPYIYNLNTLILPRINEFSSILELFFFFF